MNKKKKFKRYLKLLLLKMNKKKKFKIYLKLLWLKMNKKKNPDKLRLQ